MNVQVARAEKATTIVEPFIEDTVDENAEDGTVRVAGTNGQAAIINEGTTKGQSVDEDKANKGLGVATMCGLGFLWQSLKQLNHLNWWSAGRWFALGILLILGVSLSRRIQLLIYYAFVIFGACYFTWLLLWFSYWLTLKL